MFSPSRKNFFSKKVFHHLLVVFLFFMTTGCGKPSFPKEQVVESVKKMCKEEYHVDVTAKVEGSNLGTYVILDNIFDREQGLSKEASEHIGNILLSVSRISLSTDAPLSFYTIIAADKTIPGVEAVFIRYVEDVKRYLLGNISRDDFFQRLLIEVRYNPSSMAERTILNFFSNLSTGNTRALLANYLKKSSDSTEYSLAFLRIILEMKLKENVHFEVKQVQIKPLPSEKTLVYAKVKETYVPKQGYTSTDFTFPSGFVQEYLFLVGASNYMPEIIEIIPLDYKDEKGEIKKKPFPKSYEKYQDTRKWHKGDFLLGDELFSDFLAGQIAQRIIRKIREYEGKKDFNEKDYKIPENFKVESVKGRFIKPEEGKNLIDASSFVIHFTLSQSSGKTIPEEVYRLSYDIIKETVKNYRYKEFTEFKLTSPSWNESRVIPKETVLN